MLAKLDPGDSVPNGVTDDRLLDGRLRLYQPAEGYRFAIDPVLLAAAVPVRPGDHVFDLGAGVGAATLCLLAREPGCRVTGVERQPEIAELARRNIARNGLAARGSILQRTIVGLGDEIGAVADHVMANPPYLPPERAAPGHRDEHATVEQDAGLCDWVAAALSLVRPKGSVSFVQRADRLDALLEALRKSAGEIIVCPLWPKAGAAAKRVLVRGRKAIATPLRMSPGLVLHETDGGYTSGAENILRHGAPIDLAAPAQTIDRARSTGCAAADASSRPG